MIEPEMSGPATDAQGRTVIDPTRNVLDLVAAAISRQDDLRTQESGHVRELLQLRAEIFDLRADYEKRLREAETNRLDAIRAVDRDSVTRAAEVSAAQATTLAANVATSAEALRGQVEAQRITTAEALANALSPLTTRLDSVLAAQFAQQGEKAAKNETKEDAKFSMGTAVAIGGALLSALLAIMAVSVALYLGLRKPAQVTPAPSVGAAVACSTPGLIPGQVCTTTNGVKAGQ